MSAHTRARAVYWPRKHCHLDEGDSFTEFPRLLKNAAMLQLLSRRRCTPLPRVSLLNGRGTGRLTSIDAPVEIKISKDCMFLDDKSQRWEAGNASTFLQLQPHDATSEKIRSSHYLRRDMLIISNESVRARCTLCIILHKAVASWSNSSLTTHQLKMLSQRPLS